MHTIVLNFKITRGNIGTNLGSKANIPDIVSEKLVLNYQYFTMNN